ncbi:MAG: hypothetical protein Phog2KO_39040 [Phototrophicaceae bacterium]
MSLQDLTIEEFNQDFDGKQEFQLIDVREVEEWEEVRLPNTINIPLSEFQERIDEVSEDMPVIVVCRSGGRSAQVGNFLVANGYENVHNLLEGTLGWVRRDLPTERG